MSTSVTADKFTPDVSEELPEAIAQEDIHSEGSYTKKQTTHACSTHTHTELKMIKNCRC